MRTCWPIALACALLVPGAARAETTVGVEIGGGGATITAPNDAPGEPTLLYGTSFTGPALRAAAAVDVGLPGPLSAGAELGVGRYAMNGFAEIGDSRRDLELRLTALEANLRLRAAARLGVVAPYAGLVLGGRFGLAASATDVRTGFEGTGGAPAIRTTNALVLGVDGGVALSVGPVQVPIGVRVTRNLGYGTTTRDRFDGYRSLAEPGELVVEANWTYLLQAGVAWRF